MGETRRYFERDGKNFNFKALAELRYAMAAETDRISDAQPKVETARRGKRRAGKIDVANWVLAGYFSLPQERRDELVAAGRVQCEARMGSREPVPFDLSGRAQSPRLSPGIEHPAAPPCSGHKGNRKRG